MSAAGPASFSSAGTAAVPRVHLAIQGSAKDMMDRVVENLTADRIAEGVILRLQPVTPIPNAQQIMDVLAIRLSEKRGIPVMLSGVFDGGFLVLGVASQVRLISSPEKNHFLHVECSPNGVCTLKGASTVAALVQLSDAAVAGCASKK